MSFHFALAKKARECVKVGKYRFRCCLSGRKPNSAERKKIKNKGYESKIFQEMWEFL